MESENYKTFKLWCVSVPFFWNTVSPILCILTVAASVLQWQRWVVKRDTRPKIFTPCPFTEKVCQPLPKWKTDNSLCNLPFPGKFTTISPQQQRQHAVLLMLVWCACFLLDSHISLVLTFSTPPYNPCSQQNTPRIKPGHPGNPTGKNWFVIMVLLAHHFCFSIFLPFFVPRKKILSAFAILFSICKQQSFVVVLLCLIQIFSCIISRTVHFTSYDMLPQNRSLYYVI